MEARSTRSVPRRVPAGHADARAPSSIRVGYEPSGVGKACDPESVLSGVLPSVSGFGLGWLVHLRW